MTNNYIANMAVLKDIYGNQREQGVDRIERYIEAASFPVPIPKTE